MKFYLGTHRPRWLKTSPHPLFVSVRTLKNTRPGFRAKSEWALDSGGFSELSLYGGWTITDEQYALLIYRYALPVGKMEWATVRDWMCEPMMTARTGRSVLQHQRMTITSYLNLTRLLPQVTFCPVIQGYRISEYLRHVDMYHREGVNLAGLPVVGLGSVCRRQGTPEVRDVLCVIKELYHMEINVHAFGFKISGLRALSQAGESHYLRSSDSMAWSKKGRYNRPCPENPRLANCANCWHFAESWRGDVLSSMNTLAVKGGGDPRTEKIQ